MVYREQLLAKALSSARRQGLGKHRLSANISDSNGKMAINGHLWQIFTKRPLTVISDKFSNTFAESPAQQRFFKKIKKKL